MAARSTTASKRIVLSQEEVDALLVEVGRLRKQVAPKPSSTYDPAYSTVIELPSPKEALLVWVSDIHFPYHDKQRLDLFMQFLADAKPAHLIMGGDIFDCFSIAQYDKSPNRASDLMQGEFDAGLPYIKEMCSLSKHVHFLQGNHEERFNRFCTKNPGLYGLESLDLKKAAKLPNKVTVYPYLTMLKIGDVYYQHGETESAKAAATMMSKYHRNMVFGHTHRPQIAVEIDRLSGDLVTVVNAGHFQDVRQAHYANHPGWLTGFVTVRYRTEGKRLRSNIQSHVIPGTSLEVFGKVYR